MTEMHLPLLEASILIPLAGAVWVGQLRDGDVARRWCVFICGFTFLAAVGAWRDYDTHLLSNWFGRNVFAIDQLSAPLLPLVALLYLLTASSTSRAKVVRFSFAWMLFAESILLATFACKEPWGIIALLSAGTVPPFLELRARGKPTRVYVLHMALFVGLLVVGWAIVEREGGPRIHSLLAIVPLSAAVLLRSGIVPFHCWVIDLFEHATLGTALLFVTPIVGAYAVVRLMLPIAPEWVLHGIGLISLVTAVYAAGLALVQREARRFFCYLFLSHSALVLVGLQMVTPIGLTGALCIWLSVGLALGGFGLTLRALEARRGRLSLSEFQGLYERTPTLAMCFVLTGLASVGFPGTFGFVGTELLVDGAVESYPYVGVAVVFAAALNGIAVVHCYFLLFTGTRYSSSFSLQAGLHERCAALTLAGLILIGGLYPQPGVASRYHAAAELLSERAALAAGLTPPGHHPALVTASRTP